MVEKKEQFYKNTIPPPVPRLILTRFPPSAACLQPNNGDGGEGPGGGAQPAPLIAVRRIPLPPSRCVLVLPRSSLKPPIP